MPMPPRPGGVAAATMVSVRVMSLEKITATNTEARVRSEVELDELRQGQAEIKELLRAKDLKNQNK